MTLALPIFSRIDITIQEKGRQHFLMGIGFGR